MTEPGTPEANEQTSAGQQIDRLVADIQTGRKAAERHARDLDDATAKFRADAAALVNLVGNRQAAASLLGMTGRDLASLLPRGTAR